MNALIELVENTLKGLLQSFIDIIAPIADTLSSLGIDPGLINSIVGTLTTAQSNLSFGRVNVAPPEFLTAPPAVAGGTVNNTTVNNTFNIQSPGVAEFTVRRAAFANATG